MFDGNDFLKVIKKAALDAVNTTQPSDFYFGKVISTSPLKISIEQKMTLGAAQLVLTRNVTDFNINVNMEWETESALSTHSHQINGSDSTGDSINLTSQGVNLNHTHSTKGTKEITIHNALQIGEEVILIKQKGGQKYLVLDRVVNVS